MYTVFNRADLRENCDCGKCIDRMRFKNRLKTWHAKSLVYTENVDRAKTYVSDNKEQVVFKSIVSGNIGLLYDYEEITI
jgi:hypothetical protein